MLWKSKAIYSRTANLAIRYGYGHEISIIYSTTKELRSPRARNTICYLAMKLNIVYRWTSSAVEAKLVLAALHPVLQAAKLLLHAVKSPGHVAFGQLLKLVFALLQPVLQVAKFAIHVERLDDILVQLDDPRLVLVFVIEGCFEIYEAKAIWQFDWFRYKGMKIAINATTNLNEKNNNLSTQLFFLVSDC